MLFLAFTLLLKVKARGTTKLSLLSGASTQGGKGSGCFQSESGGKKFPP